MTDIELLRIWDDPGETLCADAADELGQLRTAAKLAFTRLCELNRDDESGIRMVLANALRGKPMRPASREAVTRDMIAAGADRYVELNGEVTSDYLVEEVFTAMMAARPIWRPASYVMVSLRALLRSGVTERREFFQESLDALEAQSAEIERLNEEIERMRRARK